MKCSICKEGIEKGFLGKIMGTYTKVDGKERIVCRGCQKIHGEGLKQRLRQIFK